MNYEEQISYGQLQRETELVLRTLVGKMWGNGGFRLDTDTLDLADPNDRSALTWLARITASYVLAERDAWSPQVETMIHTIDKKNQRTATLDSLLEKIRDLAKAEVLDVDELKKLAGSYRNPMENYYDEMREKRSRDKFLNDWAEEIKARPEQEAAEAKAETGPEVETVPDPDAVEENIAAAAAFTKSWSDDWGNDEDYQERSGETPE
jgi:hypothetical protein